MDESRPVPSSKSGSPSGSTSDRDSLSRAPATPGDAGRLGVYTALGALTGAVPIPWLPDSLARRVRGALAHDIFARQGLSLTPEARDILAEPAGTEGPRGVVAQAINFLGIKLLSRVGPLGFLPPVRNALGMFVYGHLLRRYVETARTERAIRVDVEEARRVRRAIDRALLHAVTVETGPSAPAYSASEDLRDPTTVMIDGIIAAAAGIPGWLLRRLDAAFDELLPRTEG